MTKVRAFLLIAALLVGGTLLYTRGGGGGLDPMNEPTSSQISPSIPKPAALPQVCAVDQKVDPLQEASQASQPLTTTCSVEFPESLQVNSYCLNKPNKLGGATVVLPQGTSEFINLPKNCTVVFDEDKLYAKKVACSGPAGSKVNLTVQNSCTSPNATLPKVIEPYCPPDTERPNWTSYCRYTPPPNAPPCPQNYHFDSSANCCAENNKDFPWITSACPLGYKPVDTWKPGVEESTYEKVLSCVRDTSFDLKTNTHGYTVTLGSCGVSSQNNDKKPVPCTIDPATGACQ